MGIEQASNTFPPRQNLLRNSIEARLAAIWAQSRDAMLIVDEVGVIQFANPVAEARWSRCAGELAGEALAIPLNMGSIVALESLLATGDGTPANASRVEIQIAELEWLGKTARLVTLRDVTEQLRLEAVENQSRDLVFMLNAIADAVISTDNHFNICAWNRGAERLYGWKAHEVIGKSMATITHTLPVSSDDMMGEFLRHDYWVGDVVQQTREGRSLHILASVTRVRNSAGEPLGVVAVNRDITQQRQREREVAAMAKISSALRTVESVPEVVTVLLETMPQLIETTAQLILLHDPDQHKSTIVRAAGAFAAYQDFEIPDGQGLSARVYASGQSVIYASAGMEAAHLPGIDESLAVAAVPLIAQGEISGVFWFARANPIAMNDLRVVEAVMGLAASAIQRTQLAEQVRRQADQVRQIMETVADGLILLDQQRTVLASNPAATDYLRQLNAVMEGASLQSLAGQALAEFLVPSGTGGSHILEASHAESLAIFEIAATPFTTAGERRGWVMVLRNVTEERQLQMRLQEQDRLAVVGQLAAGIAHDFNNIMTVIVLYAQMLLGMADIAPRHQRRLETILQQAEHAAHLIQQILDFSRKSLIEPTTLDLGQLLDRTLALWRRTLPENITLHYQRSSEPLCIRADEARIQQAMMNLVVNACDAMRQGGQLEIIVEPIVIANKITELADPDDGLVLRHEAVAAGHWVRIEVRDNGTGIAPAIKPRIFEPFFTTKPTGQGTGLGLAQVYGIVKQHGGHVEVESRVGEGTTVRQYLPLAEGMPLGESKLSGEDNAEGASGDAD